MSPVIRPHITVVGSINLDLVATCAHLPAPGETVMGREFQRHPGGKGANQALAAKRLGADVSMIGCIGADEDGKSAVALLEADGVDLGGCTTLPDEPTGVALIAVSDAGENQIVVAPGANAAFNIDKLPDLINGALIGQLEVPLETVVEASKRCRGFVSLNLAPALPVPDALLERADLLIVNETEAAFYGLETLQKAGGLLALTLGAAGARLYRNGQPSAEAAPPNVKTVDTTGAGDTFGAALTLAILEGKSDEDALAFACAAGALSTTRAGAQPALPDRAEVESLMK